jgi:hypothetical protein
MLRRELAALIARLAASTRHVVAPGIFRRLVTKKQQFALQQKRHRGAIFGDFHRGKDGALRSLERTSLCQISLHNREFAGKNAVRG